MKLITTFAFTVLICHLQCSLASQVKVLMYKGDYANINYVNTDLGKLKVLKVNETYNRVYIKAEIVKEWPLDTVFTVAVWRSKSTKGPWNFVDVFNTFICDGVDKNREHLPFNLLSMSCINGKNCVQKGDYEYNDAGIFQFWDTVPVGQGYYYKSLNFLQSGRTTISISRAWSKWYGV